MNDDVKQKRTQQTGFSARDEENLHSGSSHERAHNSHERQNSHERHNSHELAHEEWLSALMDGELSEFEMRRLLTVLSQDDASDASIHQTRQLLATWERFHLTRAALRPEPMIASLNLRAPDNLNAAGNHETVEFASRLALSDRINAAIAEQPIVRDTPSSRSSGARTQRWTVGAGRVAIAATVALSVFLGMQALVQNSSGVSSGTDGLMAETSAPVAERQFAVDADAQQRLNEYIRSVTIPARAESQAVPYNIVLDSSPLLRPVADRELVVPGADAVASDDPGS